MSYAKRRSFISLIILGFAGSVGPAQAEEAIATTELNVRSGPGASFSVVDVLQTNEQVTISECQPNNWCYVTHDGPDGWVSATYLAPLPGAVTGGGSDCSVVIEIGADGPKFRLECGGVSVGGGGEAEPEPEPEPADADVGACFWRNGSYAGATFCGGPGTVAQLEGQFNDSISSVRVYGGAKVKLCEDANLNGYCRTLTADSPALGPLINNRASSLVIFTGPNPPLELVPIEPWGPFEVLPLPGDEPPVTLSTGAVDLPQTWRLDLDTGTVGGGGADLWFHAVTAADRYLEPVGGAALALGDGSNRGRDGCRAAAFSAEPIRVKQSLEGSYICARTGEGRISQFRFNGMDGTVMKLGYTTWAN